MGCGQVRGHRCAAPDPRFNDSIPPKFGGDKFMNQMDGILASKLEKFVNPEMYVFETQEHVSKFLEATRGLDILKVIDVISGPPDEAKKPATAYAFFAEDGVTFFQGDVVSLLKGLAGRLGEAHKKGEITDEQKDAALNLLLGDLQASVDFQNKEADDPEKIAKGKQKTSDADAQKMKAIIRDAFNVAAKGGPTARLDSNGQSVAWSGAGSDPFGKSSFG